MLSSCCSHRCRTNILLAAIASFAVYTLLFEPRRHRGDESVIDVDDLDMVELEEELDCFNPVHLVEYRSPLDENIFRPRADLRRHVDDDKTIRPADVFELNIGLEDLPTGASSSAVKFHRVWTMADRLIDRNGLWPLGDDRPEVAAILEAMSLAPIVGVDVLDIGDYESGTADKWIATLTGGQKVVMKMIWYAARTS